MKRRAFLGLGATSVGVGALYGTGAFSSVNAGRGISVSATEDFDALVELDIADEVNSNRDGERLYTVTNNVTEELTVDTELTDEAAEDDSISLVNESVKVAPDQSEDVEVNLTESNPDTDKIDFDIDATTGTGFSVTMSRGPVDVTNPGGGGNDDSPVLSIDDVRGLNDEQPDHEYVAEVDVTEEENETTENLIVELTITGDTEGQQYSETRSPDDIRNDTIEVEFDDIGELPEDEYEYTVTADADNASATIESGDFVVSSDALPPSISVESVNRGDPNSEVDFTLRNEGEQTAIIDQISVEDAEGSNSVDRIRNDDGDEFERIDGNGRLNKELIVPSQAEPLDQNAELEPGESGNFRLGQFRRSNDRTTNMNNGFAEITLYLDGASNQEIRLEV